MKKNQLKKHARIGLAALLLAAGSTQLSAQEPITNIINTFDAAGSYGGGIGREWGPGTAVWDANGNPGGAELITVTWDPTSDSPCTAYACNGDGPNPWYNPNPITVSAYDTLEFDIKYDTTSDITIAQFNDVSTWPLTLTNQASANASVFQPWASAGQLAAGGSIGGLEITLCGGPAGQMAPVIIVTNIPAAAASGWVHVKIPINKTQAQIDGVSGIVFHKWTANTWTLLTPVSARFWIDNVMLIGTSTPPPPPTVKLPTKATPGLNVFASTSGLYDRQAAVLRQTSGLSWVGTATPANPVTYSFTIAGYPNSPDCMAWMFLAPNPHPSYVESAPDWNQTNCAIVYIQGNATSATAHFRYKVGEPNQQAMYSGGSETRTTATTTNNYYYSAAPGSLPGGPIVTQVSPGVYNITNESGDLADMVTTGIFGKWTLKFTSDTDATLIAPDGSSTNVVVPAHNVGHFAEQATPGFRIYLGMQANNANAQNQAVVYSNFEVTGTSSPYSENFLTDEVLDTTNIWITTSSPGPQGVLLVTTNASSWATWTLPDANFSLQVGTNLASPAAWTDPATGPRIAMSGIRAQLLSNAEIPSSNAAFFRLVKRTFSQLQVLLPGETNAPNTLTGKVGTPDPVSLGAGGLVSVTINAVDSTYHIVNSGSGTINLTSTDGSAIMPLDANLVNGTLQQQVLFGSTGSWTVTATNLSGTMPAATSASVVVGP
jgi:hypothetical protein